MNNEKEASLRVHPGWEVDVANLRVRHASGFTMQFRISQDGTLTGHVLEGYPPLDRLEEAERHARVAWLKDMLMTAGECVQAALKAHRH